ncbi:unnamed protein product [Lasius platythorax]|uniref:Uncharacterized protein n=1 Tax=Lasius platythorax TaxID=488582 RepID=A0AAV2NJG6_9HYME
MSPRLLDPVSRPRDFGIHARWSTSSRPWQTVPQHRSRRSFSIKNKSGPIDRIRNVDQSGDHGAIRSWEPSRADPRTSSARTNRENLPTSTWADWRTSRSPSDSPTVVDSLNQLVQPLVKESRRRRHSPSQRPDDRSNCLRPMDTDMVSAMLHP